MRPAPEGSQRQGKWSDFFDSFGDMVPQGPKRVPKGVPEGSQGVSKGPKGVQKGTQMDPKGSQMVPKVTQRVPKGSNIFLLSKKLACGNTVERTKLKN